MFYALFVGLAESNGRYFSRLSISKIFSSALIRAQQTSLALARYHPVVKVVFDPALRFYDPNRKKPLAAETEQETAVRITQEIFADAMAYLKAIVTTSNGENIVIITHGKVIKTLLSELDGIDISKISNTAMVRLLWDGAKPIVEK